MTLIQYYNSIFGSTPVSIVENLRRIEALLDSIFSNLPEKILITNKKTKQGYRIDFTQDLKISYEEYTFLNALFCQSLGMLEKDYQIVCSTPSEKNIDFNDLLANYPGMFKLMRTILFLDFHSSTEFINNSISLYELMEMPDFDQLPSTDKKESYIRQRDDVTVKAEQAQAEFDVLSVDYTQFTTDISNLKKVIHQMETEVKLSNVDYVKTTQEITSSKDLQTKSRKMVALSSKAQKSIDRNNAKILEISQLDKINKQDLDKQKLLRRQNIRRAKLIDVLASSQRVLLDDIDTSARAAMSNAMSDKSAETFSNKIQELKENLTVAEERKRLAFESMSSLKTKINAYKLELININERLNSDMKPVDLTRLSASNILELDKEISVKERTVRFLLSYFSFLDKRSFLTLTQRRDLLLKIEPQLKIRSISLLPSISDSLNFITVQEE